MALAAILGWIFSGQGTAPGAPDHRGRPRRVRAQPFGAGRGERPPRRASRAGRDLRRECSAVKAAFEGQQRLIANASHELRTPLAVMRATVDVVLDHPDSTAGDLRAMAADIRAEVDHAGQLISALADPSAQRAWPYRPRREVDLATAAEDVLDTAVLGDRPVHARLEPAVISGLSGAGRAPHREPGRQRGPAPPFGWRHLDQLPEPWRAAASNRGQHWPGHQPGRSRPHLPAVPAPHRPDLPRRFRAGPGHRRVHRRRSTGGLPPPAPAVTVACSVTVTIPSAAAPVIHADAEASER